MYAHVALLKQKGQVFTYSIPSLIQVEEGDLVQVPLQKRTVYGIVQKITTKKPSGSFTIRPLVQRVTFPNSEAFHSFLTLLSQRYGLTIVDLYTRLIGLLEEKPREVEGEDSKGEVTSGVTLTDEQQKAVVGITPLIGASTYAPVLLQGVTGSGKTEVYKALIRNAIEKKITTFFLCPEVSLARQFEYLFKQSFHDHFPVFGFHTASTAKEKQRAWHALQEGKPCLVVGVHLPILLPAARLGLIVIDEEHEEGFAEKQPPYINSKQAALLRAYCARLPIVLGSATPCVTTLYFARMQGWRHYRLTKRFKGAFPRVHHASLRNAHKRRFFWLTDELVSALRTTIARKEQAIIYLNRRGYSFFAQCSQCGTALACHACSVSMTVHQRSDEIFELCCHYCDYTMLLPHHCSTCKSADPKFVQKGIGTQKLVTLLQKALPEARIVRADTDVSRKKKAWNETIEAFSEGRADILVGTKIISKGYHFENVTLVGVVWADSSLHFPVYNAHEAALQQLIQVAGRAGRVSDHSTVIVQSFDDHELFAWCSEERYEDFVARETLIREETQYPPFTKMLRLELSHKIQRVVVQESNALAAYLRSHLPSSIRILGPARPLVEKRNNIYTHHLIIKAHSHNELYQVIKHAQHFSLQSRLWCIAE